MISSNLLGADLLVEFDRWLAELPDGTRDLVIGYGARDPEFLDGLRDLGPHTRVLWVNVVVFVANNLEALMATQDPPLPAPQSPEEWWEALGDIVFRFSQRIRSSLLLAHADAAARDGDRAAMTDVTRNLLYESVLAKVGGLDEASQRVAERWLSKFDHIARDRKNSRMRTNREVAAYLGKIVQPCSPLKMKPLEENTPTPEPNGDDFDAQIETLFEAARAAGATAKDLELLQALGESGTTVGAARSLGITESAAYVRVHRIKKKIQAAM